MVNIALILGTGYHGEDVLHKTPWVRNLDKKYDVHVVSRINPEVHLGEYSEELIGSQNLKNIINSIKELIKISKDFSLVYDSDHLKKEYTSMELEELQLWLGISLSYIASFDRRFYDRNNMRDDRDKNELKNFLVGLLIYFKEFFETKKINIFINSLEDDIFSVMAYFVAKRMGLKIIGFVSGRFPKKGVMFCNDFSEILRFNNDFNNLNFNEISSMYDKTTIAGKETLDHNKNNLSIRSFLKKINGVKYVFKYKQFRKYVIDNYKHEKFIMAPTNIINESKIYIKRIFRRYLVNIITQEPDYDDKYFLFPLHYMEDAQITFREPLLDQFKLIRDISRSLPLNTYLYVKSHPHYLGSDVSFKELFKLSRIKNIKIINPISSSIEFMIHSSAVITVNSTTGFEALIMEIPVISVGHDFYCKEQLCYVIKDIKNLSKSIVDTLNNNYSIDKNNVESFVKTVYKNTIWIEGENYKDEQFRPLSLTDTDGKKVAKALNIILNQI